MSNVTTITPWSGVPVMPKRQPAKDKGERSDGRSVTFRAPQDLAERLDSVADGLGLDVSNLVRMILNKHLYVYEEQVADIKSRRPSPH